MTPTAFDVLNKLVHTEAPLERDGLFDASVPKKSVDSLLKQLKTDGYIGVKAKQHTITPAGVEAWKQQASLEQLAAFEEQGRRRERLAVVEFLKVVEKKGRSAFKATEIKPFSQRTLEQSVKDGFAEETKAKTYKLLAAGEMLLLGEQPIETQIAKLKGQHEALGKGWHAASAKLLGELSSLGGTELEAVRSAAVKLDEQQRLAFADMESVLRRLEAFGGIAEAATAFQQKLAAATASTEKVTAASQHLAAEQARIEQAARDEGQRIESAHRQIAERLDELEKKQTIAPAPAPRVVTPRGPTDAELWETTKTAYQRLHDETFRFGGIVKVPELTDLVRKAHPDLNPAAFHEALQEWQRQDKLTLELCNDPRLEPRNAEGIHSGRGLLFYVQVR